MTSPQHLLISIMIITNLFLVGTGRIRSPILITAVQGIILGLFPYLLNTGEFSVHTIILSSLGIIVKGIAIPLLLYRALRDVAVDRELKPFVDYTLSITIGIVITGCSFWIGKLIAQSSFFPSQSMVSLALCIGLTGLFLIVSRKQAITQVIGYLVLENGIFAFGISLPITQSLLVEMGVLLDLLVCVFIMGIVLYHINREFYSISTESLESLKK